MEPITPSLVGLSIQVVADAPAIDAVRAVFVEGHGAIKLWLSPEQVDNHRCIAKTQKL
jgi:hypothetical protein